MLSTAQGALPQPDAPAQNAPQGTAHPLAFLAAGSIWQAPWAASTAFWGSERLCCGEELLALPGLD